ncbi:hypothetical protein HPB47_027590 [Ixodes persulcatus]|uniref:Uncharacterized protein n=1 Tax=Ixodes persulcatus TaxID=34615 RepID=A0AC60PVG4_IXOPE|nr:hypothetical protein HPB47_027590 [Ixodes persulcatus]
MVGHTAATTPAVGKQRRMYMAVKVLIVLVVITVNVLIYLTTHSTSYVVDRNIVRASRTNPRLSAVDISKDLSQG